jgi:hypothetical protein
MSSTILIEVQAGLRQTEIPIHRTAHYVSIAIVLPVILPPANRANP